MFASKASSAQVESEEVIVAVVAGTAADSELEGLRELHGLLSIAVNDQFAADERDNAIVEAGLRIKSDDVVLDAGQLAQLLEDAGSAKELLALVGHHGVVGVETGEGSAVAVEGSVVVLHELLGDLLEIHLF